MTLQVIGSTVARTSGLEDGQTGVFWALARELTGRAQT